MTPLPTGKRVFCSDQCQQDNTRVCAYSAEPQSWQVLQIENRLMVIDGIEMTMGEWMDARYPQRSVVS